MRTDAVNPTVLEHRKMARPSKKAAMLPRKAKGRNQRWISEPINKEFGF